jgi:hypothetical protein
MHSFQKLHLEELASSMEISVQIPFPALIFFDGNSSASGFLGL